MGWGADHQRAPDWWQAADGRWYPPVDPARQRRAQTAREMALVAGVLFVVTLVTLLVLGR